MLQHKIVHILRDLFFSKIQRAILVWPITSSTKIILNGRNMLLNGKELVLGENDVIPAMNGVTMEGTLEVAPGGCTFIVI